MSKLTTNYVISWTQGVFTITWANTYPSVSFNSANYTTSPFLINPNFFNFGTYGNYTTLDWRYETSLGSTSRAALFNNIATLTTAVTIPSKTTDNILDVNTGIYLPTVGGTPALLSYYEDPADVVVLWGTTGGALAGTYTSSTMTFIRIGGFVGCWIGRFAATASASGPLTTAAGSVPAIFAPAGETEQIVIAYQNNLGVNAGLQIYYDGSLVCYVTGTNYNFVAGTPSGINSQFITWLAAIP